MFFFLYEIIIKIYSFDGITTITSPLDGYNGYIYIA